MENTRRPVDFRIRLLALNEYRLMEMLEKELAELETAGKVIKLVTTNILRNAAWTAEVVYYDSISR